MWDWLQMHHPGKMDWAIILIVLHAVTDLVTIFSRTTKDRQ